MSRRYRIVLHRQDPEIEGKGLALGAADEDWSADLDPESCAGGAAGADILITVDVAMSSCLELN